MMPLKAIYKGQQVLVLQFLGGDEAMVRCVCVGEQGNPLYAPFMEVKFDMEPFTKYFVQPKEEKKKP